MYSHTEKRHEAPRETKPAFTFVNLGVSNITPDDVMESSSAYTYIEGVQNESVMLPLDNVYDPLVNTNYSDFVFYNHMIEPDKRNIALNLDHMARSLVLRAVSSISENLISIYTNGLFNFVRPFINDKAIIEADRDTGYNLVQSLANRMSYGVIYINYHELLEPKGYTYDNPAFGPDPNSIGTDMKKFTSIENDQIITNVMKMSFNCLEDISRKYDDVIKIVMSDPAVDITGMVRFMCASDDSVDFEVLEPVQYMGFAASALHQVAVEDLRKIKEVIEIELMQAAAEFTKFLDKNNI